MSGDPRRLALLGLLALVPVVAFVSIRSRAGLLSVACVVLITGSLYRMFGPTAAAPPAASPGPGH